MKAVAIPKIAWIKQRHPWTCALVTALNAAAWWGLPKIPSQQSKAWQRWIMRCGVRHGGATQPELLHQHLGLAAVRLMAMVPRHKIQGDV